MLNGDLDGGDTRRPVDVAALLQVSVAGHEDPLRVVVEVLELHGARPDDAEPAGDLLLQILESPRGLQPESDLLLPVGGLHSQWTGRGPATLSWLGLPERLEALGLDQKSRVLRRGGEAKLRFTVRSLEHLSLVLLRGAPRFFLFYQSPRSVGEGLA